MGCKEPHLHISLSLVDLVSISLISGRKIVDLFREEIKIGFDPFQENEPWIGRVTLELKKPCHFLSGKKCSVYLGRPIACVFFPEYCFMVEHPERILQKKMYQNFPCIQNPCPISPERRETLQQLWEMSIKEIFLSDFYLFGLSPFIIDLKNIAGEGLEGIPILENGKAHLPHHRIEGTLFQRLEEGGYLNEWAAKIKRLEGADGLRELVRIKNSTDPMVVASGGIPFHIAFQFNGNRLQLIHLYPPMQKTTGLARGAP
jgi:Fe-S-cluster containining protein